MDDHSYWLAVLVFSALLPVKFAIRAFFVCACFAMWGGAFFWSEQKFLSWQMTAIVLVLLGVGASRVSMSGFRLGYIMFVVSALLNYHGEWYSQSAVVFSVLALITCLFGRSQKTGQAQQSGVTRMVLVVEYYVDRVHPYDFLALLSYPFLRLLLGWEGLR